MLQIFLGSVAWGKTKKNSSLCLETKSYIKIGFIQTCKHKKNIVGEGLTKVLNTIIIVIIISKVG